MIVIAAPDAAGAVMDSFRASGETVVQLGNVVESGGGERVVYDGHLNLSW